MLRSLLDQGSGNKEEMEEHIKNISKDKDKLLEEIKINLKRNKAQHDVEEFKLIQKFMEMAEENRLNKSNVYIRIKPVLFYKNLLDTVVSQYDKYMKKYDLSASELLQLTTNYLKKPTKEGIVTYLRQYSERKKSIDHNKGTK